VPQAAGLRNGHHRPLAPHHPPADPSGEAADDRRGN